MASLATNSKPAFKASTRKAPVPKPAPPGKRRPELVAGMPTLDIEMVMVNATLAEQWLTMNAKNRVLRKRRIVEFRRDMLAGKWLPVGDPIRFDTNGKMLDGQHRLEAILSASAIDPDIEIPLLVVRGLKPEDHVVIDTGTRRTAADQLRIAGYANYTVLGAAAKWCLLWDRKAIENSVDGNLKSVTHAEIMDYVEKNPDLQSIVNTVGAGLGRRIDMPNGYVAAGWYLCWRIDPTEADEFFGRFSDGIGLYDGDPILALRNRLADVVRNRGNLSAQMYLSVLFRAWNAKREGRTLRMLPLDRRGVTIPAPDLR